MPRTHRCISVCVSVCAYVFADNLNACQSISLNELCLLMDCGVKVTPHLIFVICFGDWFQIFVSSTLLQIKKRNITVLCLKPYIGKQCRRFTACSQWQASPHWTGASCATEVFSLWHLPHVRRGCPGRTLLCCHWITQKHRSEELVGVYYQEGEMRR